MVDGSMVWSGNAPDGYGGKGGWVPAAAAPAPAVAVGSPERKLSELPTLPQQPSDTTLTRNCSAPRSEMTKSFAPRRASRGSSGVGSVVSPTDVREESVQEEQPQEVVVEGDEEAPALISPSRGSTGEYTDIQSLNTRTFESIEAGMVRRRDAIYQANARAIRALEPLISMPPMFNDPHRNRVGKLLPPLECVCSEDEKADLACILWQEEKNEEWMQQQVKECSSLLRRAEKVLAFMKKKDTIRVRSVAHFRAGRRGSIALKSFHRENIKQRQERSALRTLATCGGLGVRLWRYFSINSPAAKLEFVSPAERTAKLDKPLTVLFYMYAVTPCILLLYHRIEPLEDATFFHSDNMERALKGFYWWNVILLLAMVPMFVMGTVFLKHNIDFKIWRYAATRPQSRVLLGANLLGMVITWYNVTSLAKDQLSALQRAYYCVDALIYYLMLHMLVLRDALQAKPWHLSIAVYMATIIYSMVQFLCRIIFEFEIEQSTLISLGSGENAKVIVQKVMEAINSSSVMLLAGNFIYIVKDVDTVVWAPLRLSKHDLQNELYLMKVRRAYKKKIRLDHRRGQLKEQYNARTAEEYQIDPARLEQAVTVIQRRWRAHQAAITLADVAVEMMQRHSNLSTTSSRAGDASASRLSHLHHSPSKVKATGLVVQTDGGCRGWLRLLFSGCAGAAPPDGATTGNRRFSQDIDEAADLEEFIQPEDAEILRTTSRRRSSRP